jgi:hypothetical protein
MNASDSTNKSGLLEKREVRSTAGRRGGVPTGNDAWQRHVMAGLWIFVAVLFLVTSLLLYAKAHGFLAGHDTPVSSWPASWP